MSVEIKTLGELSINNKGSYGIAASAVPYSPDLYTYLRITDITDSGTLNVDGLMSVADENASEYLLQPYDIVFARTGASTGRNYFYDGTDGEFVYAGFLIKFSIDANKVNPYYVKYFCQSNSYKQWVQSFNTGSTRGNLNAKTYADMPIPVPSRQQQDFLVSVLQPIDDKIALNQQINKNLEEQAQEIFNKYFIDVPDIPDGWSEGSLTDIADYLNGLAMQKFPPMNNADSLPVLKIKELRQGMCDSDSDRCSVEIKPDYIIQDGDVIFSWSGSLLVDFWCGGDCGLNQHLFKVSSAKYDKWFYYSWTIYHLQEFVRMAADRATTMGHIKRDALEKARVLIPCHDDYVKIGNLLQPLYDLIITNRIENRRLANLRDALLPRLMSGEIDVSGIEILPNDLAKAVADSRERHNLHGPFDSAEEAVASMLKEG